MNGKYLLDTNAALVNHLTLVTDDDKLFNIQGLNVIHLSDLFHGISPIASDSVE